MCALQTKALGILQWKRLFLFISLVGYPLTHALEHVNLEHLVFLFHTAHLFQVVS